MAVVGVIHRVFVSPAGRVILADDDAPWITAALPFSANNRQWGRVQTPPTAFDKRFGLPDTAGPGRLWLRAFGSVTARLNGSALPLEEEPEHWQAAQRIDVTRWLVPGENRLQVEIRNFHGPGLLSARLEVGGLRIATDASWQARVAGRPFEPSVRADDRRPHPDAQRPPGPSQGLAEHGLVLGGIFCGWALLHAAMARRFARGREAEPPDWDLAALGLVTLLWLILFFGKFVDIAPGYGFDAAQHLEYVAFLMAEGRVPLATDGWSMYHPPLYHLIEASAMGLAAPLGGMASTLAQKGPSFLAGLGTVWLTGLLARRLFPGAPATRLLAIGFAGILPMNLYLAAYVSNEGLHAFLAAGAMLACVDLLLSRDTAQRRIGLLSLWLGLALLTKYTAVVLAAVCLVFAGAHIVHRAGASSLRMGRAFLWLLGPVLLLAGWFYLRNVIEFGRPLVPNWDLPGPGRSWWSPPGFHTPGYYLSFGQALVRPFFSAFVSFWDALYSTLWGDGMLAGSVRWSGRNPAWSYTWMSVGYWLAVPATLLLGTGFIQIVRSTLRDPDGARRAALGLPLVFLAATGFMIFFATLSLPYFGQAKAFYALATTPVLALCFARGYTGVDGWLGRRTLAPLRSVLFGWLGATLTVLYLGFAG
jgi:hypothetical protein